MNAGASGAATEDSRRYTRNVIGNASKYRSPERRLKLRITCARVFFV